MSKPILILSMGPTGCGKGSAFKHITEKKEVDIISIDDTVENSPYYKYQLRRIMRDLCGLDKDSRITPECHQKVIELFRKPNEELIRRMIKIYFDARHRADCITGRRDIVTITCDKIHNDKLRQSIKEEKNIVTEIRGMAYPDWLFKIDGIEKYHIVMTWSVGDICHLINRNITRLIKAIKEHKPFRLADIRFNEYKESIEKIRKVFLETIEKCANGNYDKDYCRHNDMRFVVIDNSGDRESSKIIYDSNSDTLTDYKKAIDGYNIDNRDSCVVAGKKYKIRTGSRGGRYILRNNKRVYV